MLFGLPVTFNCRYRCRLFLFCFSAPADCIIAEQVVVDGGSVVCNYLYVIDMSSRSNGFCHADKKCNAVFSERSSFARLFRLQSNLANALFSERSSLINLFLLQSNTFSSVFSKRSSVANSFMLQYNSVNALFLERSSAANRLLVQYNTFNSVFWVRSSFVN